MRACGEELLATQPEMLASGMEMARERRAVRWLGPAGYSNRGSH